MTFTRASLKGAFLGTTAMLAICATASRADACGGFFCSRSPVDQTAEHILFTVNDDQTVTAYIQINYSGDRDDFAWIVPAPGIPTLKADFPDLALTALTSATDPQYTNNSCNRGALFNSVGAAAQTPSVDDAGVTVLATQVVGPYETATLEATDSSVLVQWLKDHDYRITDKMVPLLEPYVEAGMHFVAMRLTADKTVSDIKPLVMTYDGNEPSIPIRLTAVAAQPEMGIVTFILANRRYAPENFIDLKIPDSLIKFDQYGSQNNYLTVVSSESDKVGGQAFVTEYAKPTTELATLVQGQFVPNQDAQAASDALLGLFQQFPYITRLYARISAEEMTDDPRFMVSSAKGDIDNIHDLSDPNSMCQETTPPPVSPCTFNYCGRRGVCVAATVAEADTSGQTTQMPACICANDATARITTTGAYGEAAMYCEPVAENFDDNADTQGTPTDPCASFDCGAHGACIAMNGNPTCQCESGYAAVVNTVYASSTGTQSMSVNCTAVPGPYPALPRLPSIGSSKLAPDASGTSGGCNVAPGRGAGTAAGLMAAAGVALAAARRRRRR